MATKEAWRNRIVGVGEEDPEQLCANPANWRIHPKVQQEALEGVLDEVGWVQQIVVNQRSGVVIDGHLRVSLAMRHKEPLVPVLYVDLDEREEALILATLDPLSAMAVADKGKLDELLRDVETSSAGVQAMLAELAKKNGLEYSGAELGDGPEADVDRAEGLQQKWQVQLGQVWEIPSLTVPDRRHRVMCGDSTKAEDIVRLMGGQKADAIVADPPYGLQLLVDLIGRTKGLIIDPFLGSGTTMVAAEQAGRICYGMELEPKYVAVALERMSDMGLQPELVSNG